MEQPLDEAAVWQRVTGSVRSPGSKEPLPATCLPELQTLHAQMELCTGLLGRMARTGLRGVTPIYQAQQQQTRVLGALCYLLSGESGEAASSKSPTGSLSQQLAWLLKETEQTANRLTALSPRTVGLIRERLQSLADEQEQLWSRLLLLLAGTLD